MFVPNLTHTACRGGLILFNNDLRSRGFIELGTRGTQYRVNNVLTSVKLRTMLHSLFADIDTRPTRIQSRSYCSR